MLNLKNISDWKINISVNKKRLTEQRIHHIIMVLMKEREENGS